MKKILWLMAVIVVSLSLYSCSSDDDNNSNPLVGTKWVSEHWGAELYSMIEGKRHWHVLEFTSGSTYSEYYEEIATGIRGESGYFENQPYEYHDTYITMFDDEGNPVSWYFISSTELCNKQSKSETGAVVYKKK